MYAGIQFGSNNALPPTSQQACVVNIRSEINQPVSAYSNFNQQEITNLEPILIDNDDLNDDEDYNVESEENTDSADDEAEEFFEVDEEIDIDPNINRRGSYNPFIGHD
jgi:hypothetical protein